MLAVASCVDNRPVQKEFLKDQLNQVARAAHLTWVRLAGCVLGLDSERSWGSCGVIYHLNFLILAVFARLSPAPNLASDGW
jgi:hypothetical protein